MAGGNNKLPLSLFVPGVLTNNHHSAVSANNFTAATNFFNTGLNFHIYKNYLNKKTLVSGMYYYNLKTILPRVRS